LFENQARRLVELDRFDRINGSWKEEGGRAVSFGSDAHVPEALVGHLRFQAQQIADQRTGQQFDHGRERRSLVAAERQQMR